MVKRQSTRAASLCGVSATLLPPDSELPLTMENCPSAEERILAEAESLMDVYERSSATCIVVSNEVGLGIVPASQLGRAYLDTLGRVNQAVASRADRVYLTVAGLALNVKSLGIPISRVNLTDGKREIQGAWTPRHFFVGGARHDKVVVHIERRPI